MFRRLITLASALSLLLCIAAAALWLWSGRVADTFTREEGHYPFEPNGITDPRDPEFHQINARILVIRLRSNLGMITLSADRSVSPLVLGPENLPDWQPDYPEGVHYRWEQEPAGTYAITSTSTDFPNFTTWYFTCPIGFIMILTAILPLLQVARVLRHSRVRRRRESQDSCPTCGYDLRASNNRCPECGKPVVKAPGRGV